MRRFGVLATVALLLGVLMLAPGCQRTVEVQTGTRTVDAQGHVISENIHTLRVPADKAGDYRVVTITQRASSADSIAALYAQAQKDITSGETTSALKKLEQVLSLTKDYRQAKSQRDAIKQGKKATPDTSKPASGSKTTPTTPPSQQEQTAGSLLQWTPDAMSGFTAGKPMVDALTCTRDYTPKAGSSAQSLVIVAEQFRTADAAKAALKSQVKLRYPKDSDSATVHGHDTYFGTDGKSFAVMAFVSGSVMVAAEVSPDSGSPSGLKSLVTGVVKQLP
jgi:hypothetical protein